jgi:hypothetical protein
MILVDAHVHIYDCFDLQKFLDSAFENFAVAAARYGHVDNFTALLLLTETSKENWFQRFVEYARNKQSEGHWTFHLIHETCSIWAQRDASQGLFLIAGSQIVTEEDLEVLALLTDKQFGDGSPIDEVIRTVKEHGALPVIPWGFGKWTGKRGSILRHLLKAARNSELFLGDNGGRPSFSLNPSHFKIAESRGIRILPGSDSLPFPLESRRPGSFGFSIEASITHERPAKEIKRILLDPTTRPRAYGVLENPLRFLRNQFAMQIMKRRYRQTKARP